MIGLCYFSPLPCTQLKRVSVESVSSTTFGHKSCICSTIDSFRLFLHRMSSHHYLYHRQNMDPLYPSSRSREPVGEVKIKLYASLASQRIHFIISPKWAMWSCPWSETKMTPFGAYLWMFFSSVDRLWVKLFLFSTVLPNVTFLKNGFIVFQWENENSVSVENEKKVVGAVELKEGTTVDILTGTNKGRVAICKATILKVCGE